MLLGINAMTRSIKGAKGPGYDFWSRRPPNTGLQGHGPFAKLVTHRMERQIAKRSILKELAMIQKEANVKTA